MESYDKLVRDNIPEIIQGKGEKAEFHVATPEEYETRLFEKLGEEVREFTEAKSAEELADVMEVLRAIADLKGVSLDEVEKIRQEKAERRGSFKKRIVLDKAGK